MSRHILSGSKHPKIVYTHIYANTHIYIHTCPHGHIPVTGTI